MGDDSSPLQSSFPNLSDPSFEVDDLLKELERNCVVAQDRPVRRLIEFQRILRCVQINHKLSVTMVLHVDAGLALRVGCMDPRVTRVRSTLLFCLCLFPNLLAHVLQILLNLRILRIQFGEEMARFLSQYFVVLA